MRLAAIVGAATLAVDPWGWDRFGPLRWGALTVAMLLAVATADTSTASLQPRWFKAGWALLLTGLLTSSVLSDDPLHAVLGTPDRHLGLVFWLLSGALAFAVLTSTERERNAFAWAMAATSAVSGLWSIAEITGLGWFDLGFADNRAGGPFGQPALLGAALTLSLPISIGLAWKASTRPLQLAAGAASLLGLTALLASQTRAAWLGLLVAGCLVAATNWKRLTRRRLTQFGSVPSLLAASLLIAALVLTIAPLRERVSDSVDVSDGVVASRIDEWQVGLRALADAPAGGLVGYGPEGYRTVFGEHVDAAYVEKYGRTVVTDRAHSGPLDVALSGGLVAAAGFLILHAGIALAALRLLRSNSAATASIPYTGLASGVLAFQVQQLFLFPDTAIDPLFWIAAGIVIQRACKLHLPSAPPAIQPQRSGKVARAAIYRTVAWLLLPIAALAAIADVAADHALDEAQDKVDAGQPFAALDAADRAIRLRPDSIRNRFVAGRVATFIDGEEGLRLALERIEDGLSLSKRDPALRLEQSALVTEIALLTRDEQDLATATAVVDSLRRDDPTNPFVQNQQRVLEEIS